VTRIKVGIIGSGYVGSSIGKGFMEIGHKVFFYDNNPRRLKKLSDEKFNTLGSVKEMMGECNLLFFCLPTPTLNGQIDLSAIIEVSKEVGRVMKNKKDFYIIVIKSTVAPTTTEKVVIPAIEKHSGKKVGKGFGVCVNPEFLTEIHDSWTLNNKFSRGFFTEERVVVGESDKASGDMIEELYRPLNVPIFRVNLKTAEMIKYASNTVLSSRISFWNEIFLICENLRVDSNEVSRIVSMDKRIGKYGTIHGLAYGGKCLPKDIKALIGFVEKNYDFEPRLLKAVDGINDHMKETYGVRE
jgi:UDPglucose 6-dehydrogenase